MLAELLKGIARGGVWLEVRKIDGHPILDLFPPEQVAEMLLRELRELRHPDASDKPTVSLPEVAQLLGVSLRSVHRLFDSGELAGYKVGVHKLIYPASIQQYRERHSNQLPQENKKPEPPMQAAQVKKPSGEAKPFRFLH